MHGDSNRDSNGGDSDVRRPTGFALLSVEERRAVAVSGGKATAARGTGHKWTPETARTAGVKGGQATASKGPEHMTAIGRMGAEASKRKRAAAWHARNATPVVGPPDVDVNIAANKGDSDE